MIDIEKSVDHMILRGIKERAIQIENKECIRYNTAINVKYQKMQFQKSKNVKILYMMLTWISELLEELHMIRASWQKEF